MKSIEETKAGSRTEGERTMTEAEIREAEKVQEEYRTAWVGATYMVAEWWLDEPLEVEDDRQRIEREDSKNNRRVLLER